MFIILLILFMQQDIRIALDYWLIIGMLTLWIHISHEKTLFFRVIVKFASNPIR